MQTLFDLECALMLARWQTPALDRVTPHLPRGNADRQGRNRTAPPLWRVIAALVLLALLGACGRGTTPVPPTAAPTRAASAPTASTAPPTATPAPAKAPSAAPASSSPLTIAPTPMPSNPATPTRTAASPTVTSWTVPGPSPAGRGGILVDPDNRCQIAIPAGFRREDDRAGTIASDDGPTAIVLASYAAGSVRLRDSAAAFIATLQSDTPGYRETYNSGGKLADGSVEEITNFDLTLDGQALRGQFYFRQIAATVCVITYLRPSTADAQLVDVPQPVIDSLALLKP